ncbi:unnamed protein product [Owenia fusiformis]|uniref:Fibrinogen C-terminal domain-containing protein n=1 Tax=Owenia fusiformis TaxID=6347 RepID=A0A8S4PBU3_OWEFU|nr:unnamed protein product [Owenia fusiformis]
MELKHLLVLCLMAVSSNCQLTTSRSSKFYMQSTMPMYDDVITQMQEAIYVKTQEIAVLKKMVVNLQANYTQLGETARLKGDRGTSGHKGDQGAAGPKGNQGTAGSKGDQGTAGSKGDQGTAGPKGNQGIGGPKGDQGTVGPKGGQGTAGPKGNPGIRGPKGDQGTTGPKGDQGTAGPKGDQGTAGPKGDQGSAGPKGDQGTAGPKGDRGTAGPKGDQGTVGPKGDQGTAGSKGDRGTAGPKGDQGIVGPKGDRGNAGPPGFSGPAGEKGDKGSQGPKGDSGVVYPVDCSDNPSFTGIKTIQPRGKVSFRARCSTGCVFMARRFNGSVNFNQGWVEYKEGFGPLEGEHFIGLDNLHGLLSQGSYKLRIELTMWPPENETRHAEYSVFDVGDRRSNYRLTIGGYSGDAGDSLTYHNDTQFSTIDRDHDEDARGSCAFTYKGAWSLLPT